MKIYVNSYTDKNGDGHKGYCYFGSKRAAKRAAAEVRDELETQFDSFDIPRTKKGMLAALNRYGNHPDNG